VEVELLLQSADLVEESWLVALLRRDPVEPFDLSLEAVHFHHLLLDDALQRFHD